MSAADLVIFMEQFIKDFKAVYGGDEHCNAKSVDWKSVDSQRAVGLHQQYGDLFNTTVDPFFLSDAGKAQAPVAVFVAGVQAWRMQVALRAKRLRPVAARDTSTVQ